MSSTGFMQGGRSGSRVSAPPGGHSTFSFGDASTTTPSKAKPDVAVEVAAEETNPTKANGTPVKANQPVETGPSLALLKLQAIGGIAAAKDDGAVREALLDLIKKLQMASTAEDDEAEAAAPPPTRAVNASAAVPADAPAFDASTAVEALKAALKLRGTHGIITLGKKFRSMDDDNDRKLSYEEFKKALSEMPIRLGEADNMKLFRHFDRDCSGHLDFDEVLVGLRGVLTPRRKDMVARAYKVLDKSGDGVVSLADLEGRYDASKHPDVVAGTKSARQVLLEFLATFEQGGGGDKGDGNVTLQEFEHYYALVSASVDDDDYFELMIRNVWHISGGEGWCANTTCKRLLVIHDDGSQTVEEVKDDFDVDLKDIEGIKRKLTEQGVQNITSVSMYGSIDEPSGAGPSAPLSPSASSDRPNTASSNMGRRRVEPHRSSIVFG